MEMKNIRAVKLSILYIVYWLIFSFTLNASNSIFHISYQINNNEPDTSNEIIDTLKISNSIRYEVEPLNIKIIYPSSGIQFYKEGIIYLFDFTDEIKDMKDHVSFGSIEMYYSTLSDGILGEPGFFSQKSSFPFPAEATSFTNDFGIVYFTKFSKFQNEETLVKIYKTEFLQDKKKSSWGKKYDVLDFNTGDYSCTQPAISPDGKSMVFSSDMPGGQGKFDLYVVYKNNDTWSKPQNLGAEINTEEDESFPFLDNSGLLFFSSNGHKGFGGFDVYMALPYQNRWKDVTLLPEPLNSTGDEVAFTISPLDKKNAFFSSNRFRFKKIFQVFSATLITSEEFFSGDWESVKPEVVFQTVLRTGIVQEDSKDTTVTASAEIHKPDSLVSQKEIEIVDSLDDELTTPLVATEEPVKIEEIQLTEPEVIPPQPVDEIEFRVQVVSSTKPRGSSKITIGKNAYDAYEYFYKGAYRYTIGHFKSLDEAIRLQSECRKNGFKEAFVVAFKGNERVVDPSVFK